MDCEGRRADEVTAQRGASSLRQRQIVRGRNGDIVQLTPWSRVLPEKLKSPELLKKFPAFYGTRRFVTAFTTARHLSLS